LRQGFGGFFVFRSDRVSAKKVTKPQPPATSRRAKHGQQLAVLLLTLGSCKNRQRSCHEEGGGTAKDMTSLRQ